MKFSTKFHKKSVKLLQTCYDAIIYKQNTEPSEVIAPSENDKEDELSGLI